MTVEGEAALAVSYTQIGVTEDPPGSNNVPYDDGWGFNSAWCATFVSWCRTQAGYPLPPINGPLGFSYCPDGNVVANQTGQATSAEKAEPGDILIFSWEEFYYGSDGVAYCSYGAYAGTPAGDHTGFFAGWEGGSYMRTVEGNTSSLSWDNGGEVRERTDRYAGQVCTYARFAGADQSGGGQVPAVEDEDDEMKLRAFEDDTKTLYAVDGLHAYALANPAIYGTLCGAGMMYTLEEMDAKGWPCRYTRQYIRDVFIIHGVSEDQAYNPDKPV